MPGSRTGRTHGPGNRELVCDGRYRIHSVKPAGRHPERIIEIEDVDRRERFHGSARDLERLAFSLVRARAATQLQSHRESEN